MVDLGPVDRDVGELGHDEEGVRQDEENDPDQAEGDAHDRTSVRSVEPATSRSVPTRIGPPDGRTVDTASTGKVVAMSEDAPPLADEPLVRRHTDAVRAAARLAKVAGSALGDAELTLPQYRVLVFLDGGPRPATEVATLIGVTPSTVTSMVDGLTARSLVLRTPDSEDRRRVMLSLTDAGPGIAGAGRRSRCRTAGASSSGTRIRWTPNGRSTAWRS